MVHADKKERTKCNEHVGMPKGANITIVSTTLLIGLNIKSYEIFACILIPFFLTNLVIAKSRLSQSNTEILCAERVKL